MISWPMGWPHGFTNTYTKFRNQNFLQPILFDCFIFVSTNQLEIRENSEFEILNSDKWYAHLMVSQIYQIPKSDFFQPLSVSFLFFCFD